MNHSQTSRILTLLACLLPTVPSAAPPAQSTLPPPGAQNVLAASGSNVTLRIPYEFNNLDDLNRWRSDYGKTRLTKILVNCGLFAGGVRESDRIGEESVYYQIGSSPKGTLNVNFETENHKLPNHAICTTRFIDETGAVLPLTSAIEESGLGTDYDFKSEKLHMQH